MIELTLIGCTIFGAIILSLGRVMAAVVYALIAQEKN